ncbi:hypothetical protein C6P42_001537 [Pichia californica]|nr:hypothetical protein C6P42_001537 [[Candida] californica]
MRMNITLLKITLLLSTLGINCGLSNAVGIKGEQESNDLIEPLQVQSNIDDIIVHDSISNKENVLKIQDDFPVYENFKVITTEKTVYITQSASTIYITVTEYVTTMFETQTQIETNMLTTTETKTATVTQIIEPVSSSSEIQSLSSSFDENESIKKTTAFPIVTSFSPIITNSIMDNVSSISSAPITSLDSLLSVSLYSSYVSASPTIGTTLNSNITTSHIKESKYLSSIIPTTIESKILAKETTSSYNKIFTTKGELDMILGDRNKLLTNLKSSLSSKTSITPSNEILSSKTGELTSTNINESDNVSTGSSTLVIQTLKPESSLVPSVSFTTIGPITTPTSINSNSSSNNLSIFNNTYHNDSGIEQLLRNFSPYTDLPHAEFEMSNDGNRFPMREWSISVSLVNDKGVEVPATIFDKVTYALHPTFANPIRSIKKPPFTIKEQGWGGFDIPITMTLIEKGGDRKVNHDLNFYKEKYIIDKQISINTTKPNLLKELAKSGPIPTSNSHSASTPASISTDIDSTTIAADSSNNVASSTSSVNNSTAEKRKIGSTISNNSSATPTEPKNVKRAKTTANKGGVDLEKMADLLSKLKEDDLLGVVQMINDNRTPEMNIKNDVDNGEFTMDLYTLPDTLLKSLWDYIKKKAE